MIDLHCHSHYSDGLLSPQALLDRALNAELEILALTDHDSTAGLAALVALAQSQPIRIIPGIELSVRWKKYDLHVIGLQIDVTALSLIDLITQQTESRIARAKAIGDALERCGLEQAYLKACDLAGHTRVGRSHFAQLLLREGMVQEPKAAFTRYLGQGKIAFVASSWVSLADALAVIIAAGGQPVLAHPLKYGLTRTKLHELINDFKDAGGQGVEVVSGDMMVQDIHSLAALCDKFDLFASTGSDYHGDGISRVPLGRQKALPSTCRPIWHTWE